MAIHRQAHFKQKMCRDSDVLKTRYNVQYEASNRKTGHQAGDPDESPHVTAKQRGVDQQLGKIWLHQTNARGQQAHQRHYGKSLGVWEQEAESTSVLSEPDSHLRILDLRILQICVHRGSVSPNFAVEATSLSVVRIYHNFLA